MIIVLFGVLILLIVGILVLLLDQRKHTASQHERLANSLDPNAQLDMDLTPLDALRAAQPEWAAPHSHSPLDRQAQATLLKLVEGLPGPSLPFLQRAPELFEAALLDRAVGIAVWRRSLNTPDLVVELRFTLPWPDDADVHVERPANLDAPSRILTGTTLVDTYISIAGADPLLQHMLTSQAHDALLDPALAAASIHRNVACLRLTLREAQDAQRFTQGLLPLIQRWLDAAQTQPSAPQLLRALLAQPDQPNAHLIAALKPSGHLHDRLEDVLTNPVLHDPRLLPLAWLLATTFAGESPDALFTPDLLSYGLEHAADDAQRDALLARARRRSEEAAVALLRRAAQPATPHLCMWAARHALRVDDPQLRLEALTLLALLTAHAEVGAQARHLLLQHITPDQYDHWCAPRAIFTHRLIHSRDAADANPLWTRIMDGREQVTAAEVASASVIALAYNDRPDALTDLFAWIDKLEAGSILLAILTQLADLSERDPALARHVFASALRRSDMSNQHIAIRVADAHNDAHYATGLEHILQSSPHEQCCARALRALLPRLKEEARELMLARYASRGHAIVRLTAINALDGHAALSSYVDCLTHNVCPHQAIADNLDWLERMTQDDPASWQAVLTSLAALSRAERMTTLIHAFMRGLRPPLALVEPLLDLRSTSEYELPWADLSPWLLSLTPGADAERIWRAALLHAPPAHAARLIALLGQHGAAPSIGALRPLIDHPTLGAAARLATTQIEARLGVQLSGSLEWVQGDDQQGQLSLTDPTQGQLSIIPEQSK